MIEHQNFFKPYPQGLEKGATLLNSKAILSGKTYSYQVEICQSLIMFDNMYIQFEFDLKFCVYDGQIIFELHGQTNTTMTFKLPLNDQKLWEKVLRKRLNQKGFHQIFKPLKKIGKGSFATVFLVEKLATKEMFACKAFSKEAAYNEENGKQCLIKEIQILRCLNHKNIMKLEEVFESDNSLYMIFEFLKGGQLLNKTEEKFKFKNQDIQKIIKGILQGLECMHRSNIMHRDLKPQNILIKEKNDLECCIADFGLAQFSDSPGYLFVRCGTPGFVAPQVINIRDMNTKYSPVCDIFSLGLIFHILLTGKHIFKSQENDALVKENRACQFDFEQGIYNKIPHQAMDLMKKMLRVNPQERINAEQALSHPFFKETNEYQMINENSPQKVLPKLKPKQGQQIKDSCIAFKMGKENIMNGKTETINDMSSKKVSALGKSLIPGRISKVSKFNKMS